MTPLDWLIWIGVAVAAVIAAALIVIIIGATVSGVRAMWIQAATRRDPKGN